MKSILLLAYAISPTKGSEYSVGWNFILELSKTNKIFILCGLSGDHMGDTEEIENYFKINPNPNIHLISVKPTKLANLINLPNRKGFLPYISYIAFQLWQIEAYKKAKKIMKSEKIDIIHHYNPIGFREPGYLWKLDKPFVWGPIGGANFINPILLEKYPFKIKMLYLLKNWITRFQLQHSKRVKKAAEKAVVLIFCNSENKFNFKKYIGKIGQVISEQSIPIGYDLDPNVTKSIDGKINIIWIGRLVYIKNIKFLFEALAQIKNKTAWHLNIVGDGPLKDELNIVAIELKIEKNISWHGFLAREKIVNIIQESDLHALTSLSEANTTVLYETRALGIPTISLDQNGMHDTLADGRGILIPISTYDETLKLFAREIDTLIENPILLDELKEITKTMIMNDTWERKIQKYENIYDDAIRNYNK